MIVFPGPLAWFQKRLWRLKWLEFMFIYLFLLIICIMSEGVEYFGGLAECMLGVIMFPLGGLLLWLNMKLVGKFFCIASLTSIVVRAVRFNNDRLLSRLCEEEIIFFEEY